MENKQDKEKNTNWQLFHGDGKQHYNLNNRRDAEDTEETNQLEDKAFPLLLFGENFTKLRIKKKKKKLTNAGLIFKN